MLFLAGLREWVVWSEVGWGGEGRAVLRVRATKAERRIYTKV